MAVVECFGQIKAFGRGAVDTGFDLALGDPEDRVPDSSAPHGASRLKEAVSQRSASGGEIPDYLGIDAIYSAFCAQPDDVRDAVRVRIDDLIAACRILSEGEPVDILSRVAVIFEARQ